MNRTGHNIRYGAGVKFVALPWNEMDVLLLWVHSANERNSLLQGGLQDVNLWGRTFGSSICLSIYFYTLLSYFRHLRMEVTSRQSHTFCMFFPTSVKYSDKIVGLAMQFLFWCKTGKPCEFFAAKLGKFFSVSQRLIDTVECGRYVCVSDAASC